MKTPLMMIINPAAGKGGFKKSLPDALRLLSDTGYAVSLFFTECRGHATELATQYAGAFPYLLVLGGDGTLAAELLPEALKRLFSMKVGELCVIHFPEGAVPKDGPSAGIAITTALCSALTGRRIRARLAMTGEVTLRGRVLPIGGLKEKTMAALRYGVETVLIPQDNVRDLEDIDQTVRKALRFIPVRTVDEVLTAALCPREETAEEPAEAAFAPVTEPARPALRQ